MCRHVSVTMKNYRPEMVLGESPRSPLTEGGLAIRVGSFSGKPITPKAGLHTASSCYLTMLHVCIHQINGSARQPLEPTASSSIK